MIGKVLRASSLFRRQYGHLRGFLLWTELLKEKLHAHGQPFSVHVPGARAPIWLRARTSDVEAFCQIFGHVEMGFFSSSQAHYMIDAGANIGLTSVFLAMRYPDARIDALEVDSQNCALLRRNTAPYKNVHLLEKGLWSHACKLKILNPEAEPWAYRVGPAPDGAQDGIPATGVAELLAASGFKQVDLLKIDIEGSEIEVLNGQSGEWMGAIKTMAIELHDWMRSGCSDALQRAVDVRRHTRHQSGEYHVIVFE